MGHAHNLHVCDCMLICSMCTQVIKINLAVLLYILLLTVDGYIPLSSHAMSALQATAMRKRVRRDRGCMGSMAAEALPQMALWVTHMPCTSTGQPFLMGLKAALPATCKSSLSLCVLGCSKHTAAVSCLTCLYTCHFTAVTCQLLDLYACQPKHLKMCA